VKPLITGFFALIWGLAAHAAGFQVQPVRLDLDAAQNNAVLTVSNPTKAPLLIQAEAFAWRQENNEDILEPTSALLLNPPIFELAPGARQLVRVGRRPGMPSAAGREASYRLWLSQLPNAGTDASQGIRLLFRVSLPVFIASTDPGRARPVWSLTREALVLSNSGTRHLHLRETKLLRIDGTAVSLPMRYVLPGAYVSWPLPPEWRSRAFAVEADTDAGSFAARLDPGEVAAAAR
jgi:fimbrial chaperone protein